MAERRGNKRNERVTIARQFFLARHLLRGPKSTIELLHAARREFGREIYSDDDRAASAAVRRDLRLLRDDFACVIERNNERKYELLSLGSLAVFDLPDTSLDALATLQNWWEEGLLPESDSMGVLLQRMTWLLPIERQRTLARMRNHLHPDQSPSAQRLDRELLAQIKRACKRQQIEFNYRSPLHPELGLAPYRVAPYEVYLRDTSYHLRGYCISAPRSELQGYHYFRLDQIEMSSLKVLNVPIRDEHLQPPRFAIRYWLSPQLATHNEIARWFAETRIFINSDGSAIVSAICEDLWQARQILIRYREHCRVLEPSELVTMFNQTLSALNQRYLANPGLGNEW